MSSQGAAWFDNGRDYYRWLTATVPRKARWDGVVLRAASLLHTPDAYAFFVWDRWVDEEGYVFRDVYRINAEYVNRDEMRRRGRQMGVLSWDSMGWGVLGSEEPFEPWPVGVRPKRRAGRPVGSWGDEADL